MRAGAAAGRGAETVALLRELAAPARSPGGPAGPVALPGLDRRGARGRRDGVRGRRAASLGCPRAGTAGLDSVRRRGQGPAAAGGRPAARDCADRGRDALLLGDAPLPRRAHRRGHCRGPAAGRQQPAARARSQPARRRPGHRRPPRSRPRRLPRLAQGRAARSPPPTPISGCSSSRPATAPPACSGWPRRCCSTPTPVRHARPTTVSRRAPRRAEVTSRHPNRRSSIHTHVAWRRARRARLPLAGGRFDRIATEIHTPRGTTRVVHAYLSLVVHGTELAPVHGQEKVG